MRVVLVLVLLVPLLAGCGHAARDFDDICNAEQRSGAAGVVNPLAKARTISAWVDQRMRTREAQSMLQELAGMSDPAAKKRALLTAARAAGYTGPCPTAEALR